MFQKKTISILGIRELSARHPRRAVLVCFFLLLGASFGGFVHNHSDDLFHAHEHASCPAAIWAHTPFDHVSFLVPLVVPAVIAAAVFLFIERFISEDYFFLKASRAPPVFPV